MLRFLLLNSNEEDDDKEGNIENYELDVTVPFDGDLGIVKE